MAWVTFSSAAEATAAVKLTGTQFNGRELRVEIATRDPNAPKGLYLKSPAICTPKI